MAASLYKKKTVGSTKTKLFKRKRVSFYDIQERYFVFCFSVFFFFPFFAVRKFLRKEDVFNKEKGLLSSLEIKLKFKFSSGLGY